MINEDLAKTGNISDTTAEQRLLGAGVYAGLRLSVAIVGRRNAGKSSLLNALVGQKTSIVSSTPGTTADAVCKAYELIGVGPVSLYDTAGLDDEGDLGALRVNAAKKIINRADLVLLVVGQNGIDDFICSLKEELQAKKIPFIIVFNFADLRSLNDKDKSFANGYNALMVSAATGEGIEALQDKMMEVLAPLNEEPPLVCDLIAPKETVMLVTPIDLAAPKGRLIMPQVQVLREILDSGALALVVKEDAISDMLSQLKVPPSLVITDSQVVEKVASLLPKGVRLTTFSILFARYKGDLAVLSEGAAMLDNLQDGDKVLIAEGCSHRVTCDDIGRVKIPKLLAKYTKKQLIIDFASGFDFPDNLNDYKLVIHCGGCVLTRRLMLHRINECVRTGVKITNYGVAISKMRGVKGVIEAAKCCA